MLKRSIDFQDFILNVYNDRFFSFVQSNFLCALYFFFFLAKENLSPLSIVT